MLKDEESYPGNFLVPVKRNGRNVLLKDLIIWKKKMLQWHPAFYAGIQIEFSEEADMLSFENEHLLGTKPKAIDVLILKKNPKKMPYKYQISQFPLSVIRDLLSL